MIPNRSMRSIFIRNKNQLTQVRCSFVVKSFVIGKRHVGNVAVNGG